MKVVELALPPGVAEILHADGIDELYPPQQQAAPIALSGKNMVLAVPTASGKSLIGYLAATRHVLEKGGKVIYIVPLRALASEKFEDLRKFEPLGIRVTLSSGDLDAPDVRLNKTDILVATSEKADSLTRHRNAWLQDVSLVVADEVHLINDPSRGPTLEVTLAKLRKLNPNIQVIALSATIGNSKELADWLQAEHITSKWRPVKLKEGVHFDEVVQFTDNTKRKVPFAEDQIWSLIKDSLAGGGQCIVFVNTRKSTESLAMKYCKLMKKFAESAPKDKELENIDGEVERTTIAKSLRTCLKGGVAFHHAGLTPDQRCFVEDNFKKGKVRVIVATPTLAAGINLPARRVIVRDMKRYEDGGNVPISVMEIKQMCGRAGRPRYDSEGEAILIARSEKEASFLFDNYLLAGPEDIFSKLDNETVLRTHILSIIATETVSNWNELMQFLSSTFLAHQKPDIIGIEEIARKMVEYLDKEGMVKVEGENYSATFFGKRVSDLYIDPVTAVNLRDALRRFKPDMGHFGFLLAICSTPDMKTFYNKRGDEEWLECILTDRCKDLLRDVPDRDEEYGYFLSEFKTAVTLEEWINETDEEKILDDIGIGPGDLRQRVDTAKWLLNSMRELSSMFNDEAYPPLKELITRVKNGVRTELLDLIKLKGVGRVRARSLFDRGFIGREELRRADVRSLAAVIGIGETLARSIKEQVGTPSDDTDSVPAPIAEKEPPRAGQTRLTDYD